MIKSNVVSRFLYSKSANGCKSGHIRRSPLHVSSLLRHGFGSSVVRFEPKSSRMRLKESIVARCVEGRSGFFFRCSAICPNGWSAEKKRNYVFSFRKKEQKKVGWIRIWITSFLIRCLPRLSFLDSFYFGDNETGLRFGLFSFFGRRMQMAEANLQSCLTGQFFFRLLRIVRHWNRISF